MLLWIHTVAAGADSGFGMEMRQIFSSNGRPKWSSQEFPSSKIYYMISDYIFDMKRVKIILKS